MSVMTLPYIVQSTVIINHMIYGEVEKLQLPLVTTTITNTVGVVIADVVP